MMVVSMLQIIIEFPGMASIKDKRREIVSLKSRLSRKFRMSAAEIDLQKSLQFTQLGCAYVSNEQILGERVMQKAVDFIEANISGRVHDFQIHSETYT